MKKTILFAIIVLANSIVRTPAFAQFGPQQIIAINTDMTSPVYAADMDGDGDMDVLSCSIATIAWYENLGGGTFGPQQIISTIPIWPMSVYAADMDGDGDMDVLSASVDDKIAWYENLGGGTFGLQQIITTSAKVATCVYTTDLDGDSDMDVLSASQDDDKIAWYENLGGGTFGPQQIITTNADGANTVHAADIDGDGDMDVLSASHNDNKIAWYENVGLGTIGPQQIITTSTDAARCVYTADLDGDGDMDVLSASQDDDKIAWYENIGGGTFGPQQIITTSADMAQSVFATDFDGDGDHDVLSASWQDDKIAWYENYGDGTFGPQQIITISADEALSIYAEDLDGDGDMDVLSASFGDDKIAWYENLFNNYYRLEGRIFYDANQNGKIDPTEYGFNYTTTNLQPDSLTGFTYSTGKYFHAVDSGTYTVGYNLPDTFWTLTTDSSTYTSAVSSTDPVADSLNFGFYPNTILTDIKPTLTGSFPRCDRTINYWQTVRNQGTTYPVGIIHLKLDTSISYISAAVVPDSIIGQNVYWHYDSLFFFSEENFNVQVQMPSFTSIGDTLTSILTVHELDGNNNIIYSNTDTLAQVLVCAYDPNDKSVTPKGFGPEGYITQDQSLAYLIRFQNTGNDTAFIVLIKDTLDANLDWSTLQLIASSHPVQISLEQDGEMVFKFVKIMLPDSNVNELASHGFVFFTINPKTGILANTEIYNTGHIYFDNNPAVVTNTVLNTIYDCSSILITMSDSTICQGDSILINGNYQFTPGVYIDTLRSYIGCDSILSTTLTVNPSPNVSIANFDPDTLCDNSNIVILPIGSPIGGSYSGAGVNGIYFDPVVAGTGIHSIIYTYSDTNNCLNRDTTKIAVQSCVGIEELSNDFGILVYPNPNTGQFTIEKPNDLNKQVDVKFLDATSKLIFEKVIPIGIQKVNMDITYYSKGIYYLQLTVNDEIFVKEIIMY